MELVPSGSWWVSGYRKPDNNWAYLGQEGLKDLQSEVRLLCRCAQALMFTSFCCCYPAGYANAIHWKVYIVARGVQPLVLCDATTLSEP